MVFLATRSSTSRGSRALICSDRSRSAALIGALSATYQANPAPDQRLERQLARAAIEVMSGGMYRIFFRYTATALAGSES